MVLKVSVTAARMAAAALVVGLSLAGCGDDKPAAPASSTSATKTSAASSSAPTSSAPATSTAAAAPGDLSGLLIKATDIVVPGDTFTASPPKPLNDPPGIDGEFANQGGTRKVDDTIFVFADPAAAAKGFDDFANLLSDPSTGKVQLTPIDVGDRAKTGSGPSPDGSKTDVLVMFNQGKYLAILTFESATSDPVPPDLVTELARKHAAALKAA